MNYEQIGFTTKLVENGRLTLFTFRHRNEHRRGLGQHLRTLMLGARKPIVPLYAEELMKDSEALECVRSAIRSAAPECDRRCFHRSATGYLDARFVLRPVIFSHSENTDRQGCHSPAVSLNASGGQDRRHEL